MIQSKEFKFVGLINKKNYIEKIKNKIKLHILRNVVSIIETSERQ